MLGGEELLVVVDTTVLEGGGDDVAEPPGVVDVVAGGRDDGGVDVAGGATPGPAQDAATRTRGTRVRRNSTHCGPRPAPAGPFAPGSRPRVGR